MFGVGSLYLDEVFAGPAIECDVFESDVADESGHFVAHVLVHYGTQADEFSLALAVHSDVFDCDVFEAHVLARLEQEWRHCEMYYVEVAQLNIAHVRGSALVAEEEDAGAVAPENRVLDRDSLDVAVFAAEVEALEGDAIVVAADEAIGYQDILGVAGIYAVVVLDAGVAELDVADRHAPTALGHYGPMRRAAKRDAADFDVGAVANRDQVADGALSPLPVRAIQDAASVDADVIALDEDLGLYYGASGEVKRLIAFEGYLFRLVQSWAEVDNVLIARFGCIRLQRICKQQQRPFFAVRLDAELARPIQGQGQRIVIDKRRLDPE